MLQFVRKQPRRGRSLRPFPLLEVWEDLANRTRWFDERHDLHLTPAMRATQGIDLVDLPEEFRPTGVLRARSEHTFSEGMMPASRHVFFYRLLNEFRQLSRGTGSGLQGLKTVLYLVAIPTLYFMLLKIYSFVLARTDTNLSSLTIA